MNKNDAMLLYRTINHNLTMVTIFGSRQPQGLKIVGVLFGKHRSLGGKKALLSASPEFVGFVKAIGRYLDGEERDLSGVPIDLSPCTPFQKQVLLAARKIAWGRTISYAELARLAGKPGAVRAAASVMRANPFPLIIPCHRVIKTDGSIGGFMGKQTGRAVDLKKKLLKRELFD